MKKDEDDNQMASTFFMKEAFKRNGEIEGFGCRAFCFALGLVIFPFEAVKTGLEQLGVEFDEGNENSPGPYDI